LVFDVTNGCSFDIITLEIAPAETGEWSDDLLVGRVLNPDGTETISIPADYGTTVWFNIRVSYEAGTTVTFEHLDLLKLEGMKIYSDGNSDTW